MSAHDEAVFTRWDERPRQGWDDPTRGRLSWFTLFDKAVTPTSGLTAGVAELEPGGGGTGHWHAQPEIYYLIEGTGVLTVDGNERPFRAGDTAFIPGNSPHALRNTGTETLRLFYVFPADGLGDVVYHFAGDAGSS